MSQEPIPKYTRRVCLHPKDTSEISLHVIRDMKHYSSKYCYLSRPSQSFFAEETVAKHALTWCRFKATINNMAYIILPKIEYEKQE